MAKFVAVLLDRFATRAAAVQKQSPFDPRAYLVIAITTAVFIAESVYIAATDLTFEPNLLLTLFELLTLTLCGGLLARRYGMTRTGDTLQAIALPPIFSALTSVATVILTRYSTPFADGLLSEGDHLLGLNWRALAFAFNAQPLLVGWAQWVYGSFYWQFWMICIALFVGNRSAKGWHFINAWVFALVATALIYPFFTAAGPYIHYGIKPSDVPNIHRDFAWQVGTFIEAIRSGQNTDAAGTMAGLVYFPSFHAGAAVLYAWACWSFRWLRWPVLLVNLALIGVTPIMGSHYFSDVVGGICVAFGAIFLANKLVSRIERSTTAAPE